MSKDEKLRQGIMQRLSYIQPYVDHWDQAMAWMAHPANLSFAHQILMDFSSQLLQIVGDESANVDKAYG